MKEKVLRRSEKYVLIYQSIRRNIPQDLSIYIHVTVHRNRFIFK